MTQQNSRTPSRRELLRPWELIVGSAIAAVFTAIIVFAGTREWEIAVLTLGGTFIVTLIALAMFALAAKPGADEQADLREQDEASHGH